MQHVEKLDSISYDQFIENYLKPGIPVVFKNASAAWKSNQQFNPDFFRANFGNHKTTYKGKEYSMNEILDITEKSTVDKPAPYPILFEIPLQLPELLPMIDPLHMNYAFPNWFRNKVMPYGKYGNSIHLFIGGPGNQYSLHKDMYHTNAWVTQLYGEKKFVVFPRDQEELLYPSNAGFISPINITKPDYEKYPRYREATPLSIVLKPGETIFIPNGIWHTTVAASHNISLIFDQLNGYNFKAWKQDMYDYAKRRGTMAAIAKYSLAQTLGSLCKLGEMTKAF
ncbi:cupin-like domain-containing protein [Larkinella rosea]|uniref:JmjC domain-containing protein n=1 Tax=Larkinella rosea TaxID=2025312 RepID=A0A3P1BTC6_9BACT|nr:cupin-like domain-containing protein [Larkinella rosea]RRB04272.1 hypothetical protein EHT25_12200 [Larkinella rosea]